MTKSRRHKCNGFGKCINKKIKLRRLDEHDLLSLKSPLKSKVKHGDMIFGKCYGDKDEPLPDAILKVLSKLHYYDIVVCKSNSNAYKNEKRQ